MLVRTESLDMYRQFNGENPSGSFRIEEVLQIVGLNIFLDEMKDLFEGSSSILDQANLLFIHLRRQLVTLKIETLNNLAAKQLLKDFGAAGIGIDQDGKANSEITQQILSVHDNLVAESEITSKELPSSVEKFTAIIAAVQREIFKLLLVSHHSSSEEIEAKETEETKVDNHLSVHKNTHDQLTLESVQVSKEAQDNRKKEMIKDRARNQIRLEKLFSYVKNIFNPISAGTREIVTMTA